MFSPMTDLVPQAIRDLLAFYKERYSNARFGDLDVSVLERAVGAIDEAAQAVVQAEEALSAARANFRDVEIEISQKAARALSFLKIFVDGDPEPLSKLDLISAAMPNNARRKAKGSDGEPASGEPRQRRSRKPKNDDPVPALDPLVEADADALVSAPVEGQAARNNGTVAAAE